MKNSILTTILTLFITLSFSQETITKSLSEFSEIAIIGRYTAEIFQGDEYSISYDLSGEEVDSDKLEFSFKNDQLTIKYSGGALNDIDLHLKITVPQLTYIEAKHGVQIRVSKNFEFQSDGIEFQSYSGGKILATCNKASWVKASVNQGGSIRLKGETILAEFSVKTGGTIGAANLKANKVNASVTMGGEIICYPIELLEAKVTSGGTISYKGEPEKIKEKTRLGGTIEKI